MEIDVIQISEEDGLDVHVRYGEGEQKLTGDEDCSIPHAMLTMHASREGDRVRLTGTIEAGVRFECDRCLAPLIKEIAQPFDLAYLPAGRVGAGEHELGSDDLSLSFYRDHRIDLDLMAREQVLLSLPMVKLCGETCRGLCGSCGANLNQTDCGCGSIQTDERWAALNSVKFDN
jgi:uncharacterized protein